MVGTIFVDSIIAISWKGQHKFICVVEKTKKNLTVTLDYCDERTRKAMAGEEERRF